ncbi:hypothetical protein [Peptoniphilus harei]|mgnify:CR=1 FL=1|uniref:DUF1659 domain-containing protein n=1 Tax=Peptoniphilus harei TaxID=54005 RepID=A0A943XUI1_9FIRM|nr:hypothetical protein [Peptoniphilus harei]MBS6534887.1 hypothetical protein [Peptoniphilus harei]MDU2374467.1 hypothetical protein [Peptoniphilus harei]MDU5418358.1 hypothetical protein [Peptoniphilus harei]
MAVQVKESKLMLKSVFTDESSGKAKKRTVTISGINSEASKDNLYKLSEDLNPIVEGDFSTSSLITEEILGKVE